MEKFWQKQSLKNKDLNIKLFITDIDGVWTDGGMYYSENGDELKKFHTGDSAGILFLKIINIKTAIVTGERTKIVEKRARKLSIDDIYLGVKNKVSVANDLKKKYKLKWNEIAFIGDDINDILLFRKVGLSACPSSAEDYIKKEVDWVLSKKGGEGVFREFVQKFLVERNQLTFVINKYLESIKNEESSYYTS